MTKNVSFDIFLLHLLRCSNIYNITCAIFLLYTTRNTIKSNLINDPYSTKTKKYYNRQNSINFFCWKTWLHFLLWYYAVLLSIRYCRRSVIYIKENNRWKYNVPVISFCLKYSHFHLPNLNISSIKIFLFNVLLCESNILRFTSLFI